MRSLAEQQSAFGAALLSTDEAGQLADLLGRFVESPARAQQRFAAYQRNVRGNWRVALGASFPVVASLVGRAVFRDLADQYSLRHGSRDGDLNRFGDRFADFVAGHGVAGELPYLPAMARLEWALEEIYGAPDVRPPDFSTLSAVPPDRQGDVVLVLAPELREIVADCPITEIWQAHQHLDQEVRDAALAAIDLQPLRHTVIVSRAPAGQVVPIRLSPGEAALRAACLAGWSLATALEQALAAEAALDAAALLPRWLARGWIADLVWPPGVDA